MRPDDPCKPCGDASPSHPAPDEDRALWVTVVIPAYNAERFLAATLESALAQTYPHMDILVIDDGSTDGTRAIAEDFAARCDRLRVVSQPNAGVAAARNLGTRLGHGAYIAYLDADDIWHPTKIEKQMRALLAHGRDSEWAGCYTLNRRIDPDGLVTMNLPQDTARGAIFAQHLGVNFVGNGSNLLVRRDAALAVGGFNPDYAARGIGGCEDVEFQLKLLRAYKFEAVREFLVGYRWHADAMSCDNRAMGLGRIAVVEKLLDDPAIPDALCDLGLFAVHCQTIAQFLRAREWPLAGKTMATMLKYLLRCWRNAPALILFALEKAGAVYIRGLLPRLRRARDRRPFEAFDALEGVRPQTPTQRLMLMNILARWDERLPTSQVAAQEPMARSAAQ